MACHPIPLAWCVSHGRPGSCRADDADWCQGPRLGWVPSRQGPLCHHRSSDRLRDGGARESSCAEQTMLVELALLEGLAKAASYEIASPADDGDQGPGPAVLRDGNGVEVLRFAPDDAGTLTVGEWRLEAYTAGTAWIPADRAQPAVLGFAAARRNPARRRSDGAAVGSTGCNGLVADYSQHASSLSFGELEITMHRVRRLPQRSRLRSSPCSTPPAKPSSCRPVGCCSPRRILASGWSS